MKIRFLVLALTLVLVFGISGSPAQASATPIYLGQTTWTATITASSDSPESIGQSVTVTGGITRVGDIYYLFQGYRTMTGDNPGVFSGGGVLLNGQLILTCSESQLGTDGDRNTGVMHVTLNQSDLTGSFYVVGNHYTGTLEQNYTAGTLSRNGEMIPLTSGLAAPLSLLLLDK